MRWSISGRVAKATKPEIVSKVQAGAGVAELAEQYAVSAKTMFGWLRQETDEGVVSVLDYNKLKRENEVLKRLIGELVEQMANYLRLYNEQDDQVGDFVSLTHALKAVAHARDELQRAVSHANAIHSKNGNAAYHLLAAYDLITLAAQQVLQNGDEGYIAEKLERGTWRLLHMK